MRGAAVVGKEVIARLYLRQTMKTTRAPTATAPAQMAITSTRSLDATMVLPWVAPPEFNEAIQNDVPWVVGQAAKTYMTQLCGTAMTFTIPSCELAMGQGKSDVTNELQTGKG